MPRRMKFHFFVVFGAVLVSLQAVLFADIISFTNKTAFLISTQSTATDPIPNSGGPVTSLDVGPLSFTSPAPSPIFAAGKFSIRLPGNVISADFEDLDVSINSPVFAYGFDFHEPEFDPNIFGSFVDSTFRVELFLGVSSLGSFTFNAPNDTASFVGVWSDSLFDRIEIREIIGEVENEFFGQPYIGVNGFLLGDVNCDNDVNLLDVGPFVEVLATGELSFKADINQDGFVNLLDVAPFVELLTGL